MPHFTANFCHTGSRRLPHATLGYPTSQIRSVTPMATEGANNEIVYEGLDASQIPALIEKLVAQINNVDEVESSTVLAAMESRTWLQTAIYGTGAVGLDQSSSQGLLLSLALSSRQRQFRQFAHGVAVELKPEAR